MEYAYVRIARELEQQIRSGRIPPGGKLPGEQELAAEYSVAGGTIRRAVRELRDRGLVETLPSLGTYVLEELPPTDRPAE
ncbi:winged helix-turn-helix domain-containing protein [Yinghuangia sp. ASG 101]|uniref:GntR family transcriptional regulator n=1 Tax=Yinghuangia sp. ASG 101 TaxID=2896848 RepID=UPI001E439102|nr:winged helix-turn-helix domain-containing protein [Yinghuangia sp. ASG 101]UGQ15035.1 winged helix-turn-helix domain-containing protein [Yinghuangia sp. ASG 101]